MPLADPRTLLHITQEQAEGLYDALHRLPTIEIAGAGKADGLYVLRSHVHYAITAAKLPPSPERTDAK